jgi:hypothetical protein
VSPNEPAAPTATPPLAFANVPPREWPPFEITSTRLQHPTVPVAPLPTTPSAGMSAPPSSSGPSAASATMVPHLAPIPRESPPRVQVDLPVVNAAPLVPPLAPMLATSIAPIVPTPVSVPPRTSAVAPVAERPASVPALAAPVPIALTVADLSRLGQGAVPDPAPFSTPSPAQLTQLSVSATPKPVFSTTLAYRTDGRTSVRTRGASASESTEWPTGTAGSLAPSSALVPTHPPISGWPATATVPRGSARLPDIGAQTQSVSRGPEMGSIILDGHRIGHWISERLAREAHRAPAGPTGFDPKLGLVWPGAPIVT